MLTFLHLLCGGLVTESGKLPCKIPANPTNSAIIIYDFKTPDYLPMTKPLAGTATISVLEEPLTITLDGLAEIIEEYNNLPD